jgi:hypothetical protein
LTRLGITLLAKQLLSKVQEGDNKEKWGNICEKLIAKGALDSQPQVIKFTSCLPMVGGSLRVLQLLPPPKLVAMI